jgi:hypothetical protein
MAFWIPLSLRISAIFIQKTFFGRESRSLFPAGNVLSECLDQRLMVKASHHHAHVIPVSQCNSFDASIQSRILAGKKMNTLRRELLDAAFLK